MARGVFLIPYQIEACWIEHLARRRLLRWDGGYTGYLGLGFVCASDAVMARLAIDGQMAVISDEMTDQVLLAMQSHLCPQELLVHIEHLGVEFQVFEVIIIDADEAEMSKIDAALEDFNRQHFCALGESLAAMSDDVIEGVGQQ